MGQGTEILPHDFDYQLKINQEEKEMIKKGYIRNGRFIEQTEMEKLEEQIEKQAKRQSLLSSKHSCPNCGKKLGIYQVDNEGFVYYSCISCGKKFRKKEFFSNGEKIK